MITRAHKLIWRAVTDWLNSEPADAATHLSDIERIRYELRPADVVLVEGRSRVSNIIKTITLSSWTHSALYIGRLHDIEDEETREKIIAHYDGDPADPLLIEPLLGKGTIITPLSKYRDYHLRICRPTGLSRIDAGAVLKHAVVNWLGSGYDVRQILDLARFMYPYTILPRRWRSSLFARNAGEPTHTVCSSMIAEAFHSVHFPVLPVMFSDGDGNVQFYNRNIKLFTPKDFDYSPYFEIIKYPMFGFDELAIYRRLPWSKQGVEVDEVTEDFEPGAINPVTPDMQPALQVAAEEPAQPDMQPALQIGAEEPAQADMQPVLQVEIEEPAQPVLDSTPTGDDVDEAKAANFFSRLFQRPATS
ncbi:MAG: hypothetical protein ACR2RB_05060 [Gammaproteobacteria bacterium]